MVKRVKCDETGCRLLKMACDKDPSIVPLKKYKRKKAVSRKQKSHLKGYGKRKRKRVSRKRPLLGAGKGKRKTKRKQRR